MKFVKPKFWDKKKPTLIAYFLMPITWVFLLICKFKKNKKSKDENIKTICVGNIYLGGTGKTPISIMINEILKKLKFKTVFIKKYYADQFDEQKLLSYNGKLLCYKNRINALNQAIKKKNDIAIFDDGLQDYSINYHLSFVCFNTQNWIGNGLVLPSGPLREKLINIKNYDAIFLNGNGENTAKVKRKIRYYKRTIKIFDAQYFPSNIDQLNKKENYLVFSGIGSPNTFLTMLKKNKIKIKEFLIYPDHYSYNNKDIKNITNQAKNIDAKILTTEKDYNRLSLVNKKNINVLKVKLKIKNEKKLIQFLKDRI
ncbi:MAG: tetraacyldisaccharide 4'-kinase [Pelagibacterales bacterium]|nr:tetraacyldisaccharide 4'-kinase [Pelagibacterales bacterium]